MMMVILPIVLLSTFFRDEAPAIIRYSPELCGIAAAAFVVISSVRHGFSKIRFIYWILVILIALHILFGIVVNDLNAGNVIVGGRIYLRTIPFFLLAIALTPSEAQLKKQFFIVFVIAMLQMPIALYQRVSHYQQALTEGYISTTGDHVVGTLGISSFLSLFLISVSTTIVVLYARKRISFSVTAIILLILLTPTMINETKATFFLAPIAFAIPMLAVAGKNLVKNTIKTLVLIIGFTAIFIPVYDYLMEPRWGYGFIDFLTMEGRVEGYLSKDSEVGTTGKTGRLDSLSVAANVLASDPVTASFGLGMGGVTESTLGPQFEGRYLSRYGRFAGTTYARMLWEIGFVGVTLVLAVIFTIFSDARRLYKQHTLYGILAHSYLAIIPIMVFGMLYSDLLLSPGIGMCFWYFCGVVAAASQSASGTEESNWVTSSQRKDLAAHGVRELGSLAPNMDDATRQMLTRR